jgi:AhpD family alkylhydroperoxidase
MSSQAISRFPIPEYEDLPADIQQRFKAVQEKAGFIPNIFLTLARRPEEFRAFFAYHDTLMDKETPGLSMAEREMIVVTTSARNQCQYCVIAHGAILRIRARNPQIADQLAANYRKADISARQQDQLLNEFGFDDEDIWDIGAISAFFGLSNRIVNLSSMRTNDEFYLMGRVPRDKS